MRFRCALVVAWMPLRWGFQAGRERWGSSPTRPSFGDFSVSRDAESSERSARRAPRTGLSLNRVVRDYYTKVDLEDQSPVQRRSQVIAVALCPSSLSGPG